MKAKDLRIGNLVENLGDIIQVEYLDKSLVKGVFHRVDTYNTSVQLKHCKPILLTDEWLIDFGFCKSQWDNFNSYRLMIGDNDYTIVIYSDGNCEVGDNIVLKLNYVHQLQNLYFALIGEELTIK